jgi:hypothetical protein
MVGSWHSAYPSQPYQEDDEGADLFMIYGEQRVGGVWPGIPSGATRAKGLDPCSGKESMEKPGAVSEELDNYRKGF